MPKYLSTPWGICDRCSRKFPLTELGIDPNYPGLRVCRADKDILDPYRLQPRQTEDITLKFYRPDVPLQMPPDSMSILIIGGGGGGGSA